MIAVHIFFQNMHSPQLSQATERNFHYAQVRPNLYSLFIVKRIKSESFLIYSEIIQSIAMFFRTKRMSLFLHYLSVYF